MTKINNVLNDLGIKFNGLYDYEAINNSDDMYGNLGVVPTANILDSLKQNIDMAKYDIKNPITDDEQEDGRKALKKYSPRYQAYQKYNRQHPNNYAFTSTKKSNQVPKASDFIHPVLKRNHDQIQALKKIVKVINQNIHDLKQSHTDSDDAGKAVEKITDVVNNYSNKYQDFEVSTDGFDDNMVETADNAKDLLGTEIGEGDSDLPGSVAKDYDFVVNECDPDDYIEDQGNVDGVSMIQHLQPETVVEIASSIIYDAKNRIKEITKRQQNAKKHLKNDHLI